MKLSFRKDANILSCLAEAPMLWLLFHMNGDTSDYLLVLSLFQTLFFSFIEVSDMTVYHYGLLVFLSYLWYL